MKERTASRGGPRVPLTLKGTLRLGEGADARVLPLVTRDLGSGGAQVSLAEPIPAGTRVLLRLSIPADKGQPTSLDFPCSVVRVDGTGPAEVALSFLETKAPDLEPLKKLLFRARERSAR
jgi:hypothetical protein